MANILNLIFGETSKHLNDGNLNLLSSYQNQDQKVRLSLKYINKFAYRNIACTDGNEPFTSTKLFRTR